MFRGWKQRKRPVLKKCPLKNGVMPPMSIIGPAKYIHTGGEPVWSKSHVKGTFYLKVLYIFHSTTHYSHSSQWVRELDYI